MKIAFTICSNNYLAQAKVLASSIKETNNEWTVLIVLVDKKIPEIDYDAICCDRVLEIESLGVSSFDEMVKKYNVIELSTAVKAGTFRYIFQSYPESDYVMYLDPDIQVFGSFDHILSESNSAEISLTPHALTPIPLDAFEPKENLFLNHGIYNLGFLLLRRGDQSLRMLDWWEARMREKCVIDLKEGYFVDQLWMNLVPVYFQSVCVLRNPGLNLAYWNFHERSVAPTMTNGVYLVNERYELVFIHFSSYSPKNPEQFNSRRLTRYSFKERVDIVPLYLDYNKNLIRHGYNDLNTICPFFESVRQKEIQRLLKLRPISVQRRMVRTIRKLIPKTVIKVIKKIIKE